MHYFWEVSYNLNKWLVWAQDDYGIEEEIIEVDTQEEAAKVVDMLARAYRQGVNDAIAKEGD